MSTDQAPIYVIVEGDCCLNAGDLAAAEIEPTFEAVVGALKAEGSARRILAEWNLPYRIVVFDGTRTETVAEQA